LKKCGKCMKPFKKIGRRSLFGDCWENYFKTVLKRLVINYEKLFLGDGVCIEEIGEVNKFWFKYFAAVPLVWSFTQYKK
jgi:hypothetical protein